MRRIAVVAAMAAMLLAGVACASLEDQLSATCRITCPDGSCGSGCVKQLTDSYAVILTAAHVVKGQKVVGCEFWSQGHQSAKLPGQVYSVDTSVDAAEVVVPVSAFGGRLPAAIPYGTAADMPRAGEMICNAGCAQGAWESAFQGHVTRVTPDGRFWFVPAPAQGRSGSVLTNASGTKIVGLLQVRDEQAKEGGATGIALLRTRMAAAGTDAYRTWKADVALTQCPGGQCGPGGCPSQVNPGLTPWPTLDPNAAPDSLFNPPLIPRRQQKPPVDLSPLIQGQAEQSALIRQWIASQQQAPAPILPAPPAPDPGPNTAAALNALGGQVKEIADNQKAHGTLLERLAAAKADVAAKEPDAPKIKQDLDALKEMFGKAWWAIVAGAVVLVVVLVVWNILHGKGLIRKIADNIAAQHPDNVTAQKAAAFFDQHEDALKATLMNAPALAAVAAQPGLQPLATGLDAADVAQQVKDHLTALLTPAPGQAAPIVVPIPVPTAPK